jgi:hypothetical protein
MLRASLCLLPLLALAGCMDCPDHSTGFIHFKPSYGHRYSASIAVDGEVETLHCGVGKEVAGVRIVNCASDGITLSGRGLEDLPPLTLSVYDEYGAPLVENHVVSLGPLERFTRHDSDSYCASGVSVPLTIPPARLEVSQPVLDFGTVTVGTTSNYAKVYLNYRTVHMIAPPTVSVQGDFVIPGPVCPAGVGSPCPVQVAFRPGRPGPQQGSIAFTVPGGSTTTLQLTGVGVAP